MSKVIAERRVGSAQLFRNVENVLRAVEPILQGNACVYATGSYARGEATEHSDLDLFIAGKVRERGEEKERALSRLETIRVKACLIEANRKLHIQDFSGDGAYLRHYTVAELTDALGTPQDDSKNTFTARLLLLLESKPLAGTAAYEEITSEVLGAYFRDFDAHAAEFSPAFLVNDILRLWRTFCVNYEARTSSESAAKKAKRKLKNYKLKHSRLLTCYSAIAYLLQEFTIEGTVEQCAAESMVAMTPTERIEAITGRDASAASAADELLERYGRFLETTSASEGELLERFRDREDADSLFEEAAEFGDAVFVLLQHLGTKSRGHGSLSDRLYRHITV